MKKVILILSVAVIGAVTRAKAQLQYELENVLISSIKINEGSNTVPVPNGRGTVKFVKRGNAFVDVFYIDAKGKSTRLDATRGGANGAPKPECKTPLPDARYGTPNKNIGLCICKPGSITAGQPEVYQIGLLLPAVQKVREAAARM